MVTLFLLLVVSITLIFFYFVYKLNKYISLLETKIEKEIELRENLVQSLKEIVAEGYLLNDGRLKKFIIQKERNIIFNGEKLDKNSSKDTEVFL